MTRPDDERFLSLIDLHNHCKLMKEQSSVRLLEARQLECRPVEPEEGEPFDSKAMVILGPDGEPATMTHYAFGQLCRWGKAPADYLRSLPSDISADALNYNLQSERIPQLGILTRANGGRTMRACTGASYGRVWNEAVAEALIQRFGDGVTGEFRVPGEFGEAVEVNKSNTTIYAGERDMFVFLADEENRIEIPNRRDGQPGSFARGFYVWNSEVGAETLGLAMFLFDYVCKNRIIWGVEQYTEQRIRHSKHAPLRFINEIAPAIESYAHSSSKGITDAIVKAQARKIGEEKDVDALLTAPKRFTRNQAAAIKACHLAEEQRPIETIWDATVGITAYAKGIAYQNERVEIERIAGKILALAR